MFRGKFPRHAAAVPLLAAALTAVAATGCYWQKYPRLVRTHVEVLTSMAAKIEIVLSGQGALRPEHLTELRYPLDRARDFARIVRGQFGERASFTSFGAFLDRYAELLSAADRLRDDPRPGPEKARALEAMTAALRDAGAKVLETLDREG